MASLAPPRITAAFVVKVGGEVKQEVSVQAGLQFLFTALKENGNDPERAAAAFMAELERLKRRA